MRKWLVLLAFPFLCLFTDVSAQLNKNYFFYVGRNFIVENKYRDAIEMLNVLLRTDTTAYEGYFLRGIAKYNLDDLLGAEQDFTRAVEVNPVFTTAYQYRAITRSRLGNYDDALKDFREAIGLRPDLPGPYYSRGVTYLLSQQFEKAVEDFTTYLRYENKVADAYINRGTSYLQLKDTARAYEDYNQAIRTNRDYPEGYGRRGRLYLDQQRYREAVEDFDRAIACDSTYIPGYFNRAIAYSKTNKPLQAIADFDRAIALDSTNSLTYFNRAILRTQIGDYNRALDDYDRVAFLTPNNVLVYYNRAGLYTQLGDYPSAVQDYSRAIELYPDFANAYLGRSSLRYMMNDQRGAREDKRIAERKIAEYRSKLTDSTFSIYADTSRRFNRLLSFETAVSGAEGFGGLSKGAAGDITLLPMFRFTLVAAEGARRDDPALRDSRVRTFLKEVGCPYLHFVNGGTDLPPDSLFATDAAVEDSLRYGPGSWRLLFIRGVTQSLIRQYTSAITCYTEAIDRNPSNPFLYINRSTTQSEMIDFISSIDNGFQRITIDSDPGGRIESKPVRNYNYDAAIADLNKAARLFPEFAYIYYNRANLHCLSGRMPEAIEDYSRAIELDPAFGEAYYNRGLIQIYLKDTRKGCLDMSKAGELGIGEAYRVLKRYGGVADED